MVVQHRRLAEGLEHSGARAGTEPFRHGLHPCLELGGDGRKKRQLRSTDTGVADGTVLALGLNAARRESREIEPFPGRITLWPHGSLHQPVHPAAAAVLPIGEDAEAVAKPADRFDVVSWQRPCQRVAHQGHADPIEILDQEDVGAGADLLLQLLEGETRHGVRR